VPCTEQMTCTIAGVEARSWPTSGQNACITTASVARSETAFSCEVLIFRLYKQSRAS
jgi:hypothetical protein